MEKNKSIDKLRRHLVLGLGAVAGTSLLTLTGCGGGSSSTPTSTPEQTTPPTSPTPPTNSNQWASGGTNAITVNVPPQNPFANDAGAMCQVTSSFDLGPCYFNPDDVRQDISDTEPGLPMIVALRVVDKDCQPVSAIEVEIWHCDKDGVYSGNSSNSSDANEFDVGFCTGGNQRARSSKWFRGTQVTDADGVVYFKTCFPGWYPGRTTHIHLQLRNNNVKSLVSQIGFEDSLSDDIHRNHPDYSNRGAKDTSNANDGIFSGNIAGHVFSTARNSDNSMLAWKTIQLNS